MKKYTIWLVTAYAWAGLSPAFPVDTTNATTSTPAVSVSTTTSVNTAPVVTSTPGATETQFGGDPNEVICRDKENSTGSMFKQKVCHTRREWAEGQDTARKMMNGFHHYQCGDGGHGVEGMCPSGSGPLATLKPH